MTQWYDTSLPIFVRKAGFLGNPITQAVALILAASNGDDAYSYQSDVPGSATLKGLFGIPDTPELNPKGVNLYDPYANAKVAYQMWRSNGKTWNWLPQFASGVWRQQIESARLAVTTPASPQPIPVDPNPTNVVGATNAMHLTSVQATGQAIQVANAAASLR